jgi:hypothetical protein
MTLATNLPNPLKKGNPILNQLKQLTKTLPSGVKKTVEIKLTKAQDRGVATTSMIKSQLILSPELRILINVRQVEVNKTIKNIMIKWICASLDPLNVKQDTTTTKIDKREVLRTIEANNIDSTKIQIDLREEGLIEEITTILTLIHAKPGVEALSDLMTIPSWIHADQEVGDNLKDLITMMLEIIKEKMNDEVNLTKTSVTPDKRSKRKKKVAILLLSHPIAEEMVATLKSAQFNKDIGASKTGKSHFIKKIPKVINLH